MGESTSPPSPPSPGGRRWTPRFGSWIRARTIRILYRWLLIAVPIGVASGFVAVAFLTALDLASGLLVGGLGGVLLPINGVAPSPGISWSSNPSRFWVLPMVLGLGGLAVGLIASRFAPETLGHGTDETIRSFHHGRGAVKPRVPFVKFAISVLTLGSGGSGGREGPTAQIGSGLGSIVASPLGLTTRERRVALMVGMGAGIGAIFKAPFGASLLAAEILYLADFEAEVIMPSIVASVISYSIFGFFEGFGPEFAAPSGLGWSVPQLPLYAILGVSAGLLAALYAVSFTRSRAYFARTSFPLWARPAIGAGLAGVIIAALYYGVPWDAHLVGVGLLGIGYGLVQWLLFQGDVTALLLVLVVALILAKIVVTALVVGSGGSGGLFGPGVVLGACTGFAVAGAMRLLFPSLLPAADLAAFAVIGMLAFFGSVSKAPIAVIVMVVEMTGTESLLVPAMMAIFIAYYVAGPFQLYSEQVPSRLASPAHTTEYFASFLEHVPIRSMLQPAPSPIAPGATILDAQFQMTRSPVQLLPVQDAGKALGELRLGDILDVPTGERSRRLVRDEMRSEMPAIDPTTSALKALGTMDQEGVDALLVLSPERPPQVVGVVTREAIVRFQRAPHPFEE